MISDQTRNFRIAYGNVLEAFRKSSVIVNTGTWQGIDVSKKLEMMTYELEDYVFTFPIGTEDLAYHRAQVGPNLPWADDHFEKDRVSGEPLNPGKTWAQWPYALKADSFRDEHGQFNHTYAERYWPKLAGKTDQGELGGTCYDPEYMGSTTNPSDGKYFAIRNSRESCRTGIRYAYGDLNDVVDLIVKNPMTRNAYMPVWFPEDTGVVHGGRTPCSIGYLFRMRNDRLSIFYDIRSCDFKRHFQDDVYLTVRLLLWVLDQCRVRDERWKTVIPGDFTMHIGSFHIFKADWQGIMG